MESIKEFRKNWKGMIRNKGDIAMVEIEDGTEIFAEHYLIERELFKKGHKETEWISFYYPYKLGWIKTGYANVRKIRSVNHLIYHYDFYLPKDGKLKLEWVSLNEKNKRMVFKEKRTNKQREGRRV